MIRIAGPTTATVEKTIVIFKICCSHGKRVTFFFCIMYILLDDVLRIEPPPVEISDGSFADVMVLMVKSTTGKYCLAPFI